MASVKVSITAQTRTNLALHHLFAACRFAARIAVIEKEHEGDTFSGFWEEIIENALGVATLTVATIEGYANELYFEGEALSSTLNAVTVVELTNLVDRENSLKKYALVLAIRTGKKLNFGIEPIQSADALIELRNAIVHFHPEWFGKQKKHDKLSKLLKHKFEQSEFLPNEPIFPRAWASASFAGWALRTTVDFLNYFYLEADLPSPIQKFKPRLSELSAGLI